MAKHNQLGRKGEAKAAAYLEAEGFVILERNWRLRHLELDLIAMQGELLVVVEVKTRISAEERPEELLNFRKRKNLRHAADAYVQLHGINREVRFDLVLVTGKNLDIVHIPGAMQVFE